MTALGITLFSFILSQSTCCHMSRKLTDSRKTAHLAARKTKSRRPSQSYQRRFMPSKYPKQSDNTHAGSEPPTKPSAQVGPAYGITTAKDTSPSALAFGTRSPSIISSLADGPSIRDVVAKTGLSIPNGDHLSNDSNEPPSKQESPPIDGAELGQVDLHQAGFDTKAKFSTDGRLNIEIDQISGHAVDLLVPALQTQPKSPRAEAPVVQRSHVPSSLRGLPGQDLPPQLNVVLHVVESQVMCSLL